MAENQTEIGSAEDCCVYPEIDICNIMSSLPIQYQKGENIEKFLTPFVNQLNCVYRSLNFDCGIIDCSQLEGDALTAYGEEMGFPRTHCNVLCCVSGNHFVESDDLYCRLLKSHLIGRQGSNISNLCCALKEVFGDDAFVISSARGVTKVSAGRPLSNEESALIELIRRCLPKTCGTKIEIYDILDLSNIVGVNCGDCSNFLGACENASALCNPLECTSGNLSLTLKSTCPQVLADDCVGEISISSCGSSCPQQIVGN